jgi:hypothetical protein
MPDARSILVEVVRRCDIVLNEKIGAEVPDLGPVVVTPPVSQQEAVA